MRVCTFGARSHNITFTISIYSSPKSFVEFWVCGNDTPSGCRFHKPFRIAIAIGEKEKI